LSLILVPLDAPGVEIQPFDTFGGERTTATFYRDVVVPTNWLIGPENGGWIVLSQILDIERLMMGSFIGEAQRTLDDVMMALQQTNPAALASEGIRTQLSAMNVQVEAARALVDRLYWLRRRPGRFDVEAAMTKLLVTETFKSIAYKSMDLVGPLGLLSSSSTGALVGGQLEHWFRHSQVATIYGGASEVQRNIIAARHLGLPHI
jgi:alkylation response protein AidB-like acyl-CoA dehydrogenase